MRIGVLAGALILLTTGVAFADPVTSFPPSFPPSFGTVELKSLLALPHSSADEQLRKESARAGDRQSSGGFRTEFETIQASLDIPGAGLTPVGNLKATRLMLSGLYEFSSGGWRLRP